MQDDATFYLSLKTIYSPIQKLIRNKKAFQDVPENWFVVVADVINSTAAVQNGMHNKVNLAATGSVVAVMNTIQTKLQNSSIPYFFGGDGVTFIVPGTLAASVAGALETYSHHVQKNLQLTLRTGMLSVSDIRNKGYQLKIAKSQLNKYLTIPVILGNGLQYAENYIKDHFEQAPPSELLEPLLNLDGMECRWDQIDPRDTKHKVICLLVNCSDERMQPSIYGDVLDIIDLIFGSLEHRQPITAARLKLKATIAKIRQEMLARIGENNWNYLLKNWLMTFFGSLYFKYFKEGKSYLNKVRQLSDTIMMDGSLNTVMEGSASQIEMLTNYLDLLEKEGKIKYGMHITYASVMSCYVQDRNDNHIHFVDGTEGGYTSAAIIYKSKYAAPAV
jgi:hypothetical protein